MWGDGSDRDAAEDAQELLDLGKLFNKDFGPLNLAMVHRYSRELARLLRDKNYSNNRIFHYCTSEKADKMVNGAFLMGAFMIIILKCSAEKAWNMFRPYH